MVADINAAGHLRQVRKYYDQNTARFLRWGKDEGTRNLHGALWPPEVNSLHAAMNYSNELVAREIERCPFVVKRVLDLGCGVGGSLYYLSRRLPSVQVFRGISLSPLQIENARRRLPHALKGRIHFEAGSFLQLSAEHLKADFSYSIEAFTHGPDPDLFFDIQARALPLGGRLTLVDDCLSDGSPGRAPSGRQKQLLDSYRRNWLLPGLRTVSHLKFIAQEKGLDLIKDQDLTPFLRLGRPRDKAIALLVGAIGSLMKRHIYLRSLMGGDAKQKCYLEGLTQYRLLVFEKRRSRTET